jgi:hypothetical protein
MEKIIDPQKRAELAASFKEHVGAYREWALNPNTVRFLTMAADYVRPYPINDAHLVNHAITAHHLAQIETLDAYIDTLFKLEDKAGISSATDLPESDYGANDATPEPKRRSVKAAKPARA